MPLRGVSLLLMFAPPTPRAHAGTWAEAKPALVLIGVLIVCLVIVGMIWMYLRRKLMEKESGRNLSASMMERLREAHGRGEISDAEYEQTRKTLAARVSETMGAKGTGASAQPCPRARPPTPDPSSRQAPPGYDLTGEPLPKPSEGE